MNLNDFWKYLNFKGKKTQTATIDAGIFDGENKVETLDKIAEKFILGQSIIDIIEDKYKEMITFVLSNGLHLEFHSNEGCGCCSNGWYYCNKVIIDTSPNGNIITNVQIEEPEDSCYGTYSVFIYSNDKRIVQADFSGVDNGYYGTGIWAQVVIPEEKLIALCSGEEI